MLLQADCITKVYTGHVALNEVTIHVPKGSIYGLLGPNGAGKTTFIRIINSITAPDSGEIFFEGKPLKHSDVSKIGYLPEERGLYKKMKVGEQVLYLANLKGLSKNDALKRAKYWFEKFEIQAWWDKTVEELSKGMQQKVQFISTVLHEPELLIFDEPFSGFDPVNTALLKHEILQLRQKGATIIFSTHNMLSVEELCDEISLINNANVVLSGNVKDIREKYKQHLFCIKTTDMDVRIPPHDDFEIISSKPERGFTELGIRKTKAGISNNELLQLLLPYCNIVSFEELLPSMNEIFIQTLEK